MDWKELKDKIYYRDGSLRDIYIDNVTKDDWKVWADFVNANYKTTFYIHETGVLENRIDFSKVIEYWHGSHEFCSTATVYLGDIQIKAHFFDENEMENDLCPKEFNSYEDHRKLVDYMSRLSKLLNKMVVLTPENEHKLILISVKEDLITIPI